ncbi:MAG: NTP transferase domain-containing protein [Candidatus Bathyarchaeota archaeon]
MRGVVLAAGRGERLRPYTDYIPKPLLNFKGRPLIDHVISALRGAGVESILVVTGYMGDAVSRHLMRSHDRDVKVVHNPRWMAGNATSLLAARRHLAGGDFVLSMCDHLYSESLVRDALADYTGEPTLCIDREPVHLKDLEDATKVQVDRGGYIRAIGKNLVRWNAVDMGVFILPVMIFEATDETFRELSSLMRTLCEMRRLKAYDATGAQWLDLDTVSDMEHAMEAAVWV